jgi:hypothetical protein
MAPSPSVIDLAEHVCAGTTPCDLPAEAIWLISSETDDTVTFLSALVNLSCCICFSMEADRLLLVLLIELVI